MSDKQHTVYFLGGPADGTVQAIPEPLPPHYRYNPQQMHLLVDPPITAGEKVLYALHNFRGLYVYAPAGEPMHLILSRIFEFYCEAKKEKRA